MIPLAQMRLRVGSPLAEGQALVVPKSRQECHVRSVARSTVTRRPLDPRSPGSCIGGVSPGPESSYHFMVLNCLRENGWLLNGPHTPSLPSSLSLQFAGPFSPGTCAMAPTPIWTPEGVRGTAVDAFRRYVNRRHRLNLTTYKDLHAWSVDDVPAFAEAVFNFAGMQTSTPPTSIVEGVDTMFPPPRWFPGAKMNYAENILAPGLALKPNAVAVTLCEEGSEQSEDFTFTQLAERSAVWANALSRMGVRVGDRVASKFPFSVASPGD